MFSISLTEAQIVISEHLHHSNFIFINLRVICLPKYTAALCCPIISQSFILFLEAFCWRQNICFKHFIHTRHIFRILPAFRTSWKPFWGNYGLGIANYLSMFERCTVSVSAGRKCWRIYCTQIGALFQYLESLSNHMRFFSTLHFSLCSFPITPCYILKTYEDVLTTLVIISKKFTSSPAKRPQKTFKKSSLIEFM